MKRGSDTIQRQEVALSSQVDELTDLLDENAELSERVHSAAERSTTLNERSMRRVSSDLHDGPGQMLSLAMLRLDGLQKRAERGDPPTAAEIAEVEEVLQEAMTDMRGVAAGLRLPELAPMSAEAVASRAAQDHERRSGTQVELDARCAPGDVPLPVKIALFRALQESLSNATRHGRSDEVEVELSGAAGRPPAAARAGLRLVVRDEGVGLRPCIAGLERRPRPGRHPRAGRDPGRLVRPLLSAPGEGTELRVWWPLQNGRWKHERADPRRRRRRPPDVPRRCRHVAARRRGSSMSSAKPVTGPPRWRWRGPSYPT